MYFLLQFKLLFTEEHYINFIYDYLKSYLKFWDLSSVQFISFNYIYIITVLVIAKSLCGFMVNQVQYNIDSAQYLR